MSGISDITLYSEFEPMMSRTLEPFAQFAVYGEFIFKMVHLAMIWLRSTFVALS